MKVSLSSERSADPSDLRGGAPQLIRLNKYLSIAGISSRRKADDLITSGKVMVNGKTVTTLGTKVDPSRDKVFVSGKQIVPLEDAVYIVLHKPKDCITTTDDEKGRRTVLDLVRVKERVYPVGRLDRNTTGVLLLTNDGELANRLMHPRYGLNKVYHIELDESISDDALKKLRTGVPIDGKMTGKSEVYILPQSKRRRLEAMIHEGRNRQVRKMFEACGYKVKKLHRVAYGSVTVEGLSRGEWRPLTKREVAALREQVGLS